MSSLDASRTFVPLNIAVLTISDTRSLQDDKSGTTLSERLVAAGHHLAAREIIVDDVDAIRVIVKRWIADHGVDVVITTGGTGFTGRDVTPEAIEPLFEKRMDGFATMFLMVSAQKIGTSAIQTRATAGVAGLIVPDLPVEESDELRGCCRAHGMHLIYLLAPTSTESRIAAVAERGSGFIYCMAVTGVTGARSDLSSDLAGFLGRVRARTLLPLVVGFGISRPEHMRALRGMVDAAVVASAFVAEIDRGGDPVPLARPGSRGPPS